MDSNARKQLIALQRSLYDKAYKDAHIYARGHSKSILAYSNRFEQNLPEHFIDSSHEHIISSIMKSNVVLFGDFHTLKQSQRALLRILRSLKHKKRKQRGIILALEAFRAKHQKYLDQFLKSEISDEVLLSKTNYKEEWGFPWANYKVIVDFAREHNIKVIGINSDNGGKDDLKKRDDFAADIIIETRKKHPNDLIICQIGEYHLAEDHLPKSLNIRAVKDQTKTSVIKVLTNIDKYFFNLPTNKPSMTTEYLYLQNNTFCIMNSPPWMKWQSYTLWEEQRGIEEEDFEEDDDEEDFNFYTEQTFDVDYHFLMMLKSLVKFLNLDIKETTLSDFSIHSYLQEDVVNQAEYDRKRNSNFTNIAIARANLDGMFLISKKNIILLNSITINNLSEATGHLLHYFASGCDHDKHDRIEGFYTRILRYTAGMISAKILNPKKKCLSIYHFKKYLDHNFKKKLTGHPQDMRKSYAAIIKHHEWISQHIKKNNNKFSIPPKSIYEQDTLLNYEISRSIGLLIGNKVYSNVMSNRTKSQQIKEVFTSDILALDKKIQLVIKLYKNIVN